jgi:predicted nucleic acid-binding protein
LILVDSSVWINYFNGAATPAAAKLDDLLIRQSIILTQRVGYSPVAKWPAKIAIGDLILTEVLQGFDDEREFSAARHALLRFDLVELGGRDVAIQAAKNFRVLRKAGVTVRKTIDTVIATRCIMSGYELLYDDRDFDPFVKYLGLREA